MLASLAAFLAVLAAVAWSSRKNGRAEVLTEQLRDTLKQVDATQGKLAELHKQKTDLVSKIAEVQAQRTHALEENLSDEEVLKRLKDEGLVKK